MSEKMYTTELNYQNPKFTAGSVFSEAQWVAKRGTAAGLAAHVAKGYITVWEGQQAPAAPVAPVAPAKPIEKTADIEVSASPLDEEAETETVNAAEEEVAEEVVEAEEVADAEEVVEKEAPQGIWNFVKEDLDPVPLEALNTMYKDHADKNGKSVRAYKDKEALIKKMCSEA